ncbi:MAG: carbon monoxide dehydrogenase, partial [Aquamicrobium sp.]|nr:carbon monoxide dehydrogenase [Aquamicrobium sp.]
PATGAASGVLSFLRLAAAAALGGAIVVLWLRYGGLQPAGVADGRAQLSPEFASAVQLIMAAAIGYLFGTRR